MSALYDVGSQTNVWRAHVFTHGSIVYNVVFYAAYNPLTLKAPLGKSEPTVAISEHGSIILMSRHGARVAPFFPELPLFLQGYVCSLTFISSFSGVGADYLCSSVLNLLSADQLTTVVN